MQLRPSLEHLNSGGSKRKTSIPTGSNAAVKIEDSAEEKSVASSKKQVSCFCIIDISCVFVATCEVCKSLWFMI